MYDTNITITTAHKQIHFSPLAVLNWTGALQYGPVAASLCALTLKVYLVDGRSNVSVRLVVLVK